MTEKFKIEFEYKLQNPIWYQDDLEDKETTLLLLKAPSNSNKSILDKIKPIIIDSFLAISKKVVVNAESKSKPKSGKSGLGKGEILMALSANNKMLDAKLLFVELLSNGCCLIDRKVLATDTLIERINDVPPFDELEDLMGEYFENFLISSWMIQILQG